MPKVTQLEISSYFFNLINETFDLILIFSFYILITQFSKMKEELKQSTRSLKWEQNGQLAHKDLSDLIDRLKNVENECNSSELSRLSSNSDNVD